MNDCVVLTDLKQQRTELKRGMARIRKDLRLCAGCPEKCAEFNDIKADIEQALSESLSELQHAQ